MKLDHLVILVRDLNTSLPWYEVLLGLLGFAKTRDHVWGNEDGTYIDLKQAEADTSDYGRYAPGLNHLGFTAPTMAELHHVRDGMAAAGLEVPELQHLGNITATFFKDPDGMRLEVSHYA